MGSGGLGYRIIVGTAERSIDIITPASDRIFKNGDIVLTGFVPSYNGYNTTASCLVVSKEGEPIIYRKNGYMMYAMYYI